eukprot:m.328511 g.328511  ORF g.328511 m.328511 type:complete len:355 (+) comp16502_c1_seq24:1590-2654(+)
MLQSTAYSVAFTNRANAGLPPTCTPRSQRVRQASTCDPQSTPLSRSALAWASFRQAAATTSAAAVPFREVTYAERRVSCPGTVIEVGTVSRQMAAVVMGEVLGSDTRAVATTASAPGSWAFVRTSATSGELPTPPSTMLAKIASESVMECGDSPVALISTTRMFGSARWAYTLCAITTPGAEETVDLSSTTPSSMFSAVTSGDAPVIATEADDGSAARFGRAGRGSGPGTPLNSPATYSTAEVHWVERNPFPTDGSTEFVTCPPVFPTGGPLGVRSPKPRSTAPAMLPSSQDFGTRRSPSAFWHPPTDSTMWGTSPNSRGGMWASGVVAAVRTPARNPSTSSAGIATHCGSFNR